MKQIPIALALVACLAVGAAQAQSPAAALAPAASAPSMRAETAPTLQAAQKALNDRNFVEALNQLRLADAVPGKTPFAPLLNGGQASQEHLIVGEAGCVAAEGGVSPATDFQKAGFICSSKGPALAHAGISDVEPALLQATINGGSGLDTSGLDAAGFVQNIFAVGVNNKLYLALQKAQGLDNAGAINEAESARPSIPKSFITGALTGQILGNSSSKKGWNLLIPTSIDANVNSKRINVCRRTPTSGTQAASNLYFANNPCGGTASQYSVTAGSTSAALAVTGFPPLSSSSTTNSNDDSF